MSCQRCQKLERQLAAAVKTLADQNGVLDYLRTANQFLSAQLVEAATELLKREGVGGPLAQSTSETWRDRKPML